jgi:glycosyltransferase involved in cell wall biosynthesis
MKKKVLFISPLPPPNYGSAMSSEMCLKILNDSRIVEVKNIQTNSSKDMSDIGKFNLAKIFGFFKVKSQVRKSLKNFKPDLIYFVPATSSLGFERDYLFWKEIRKNYSGKILFHLRSRVLESDWKKVSFRRRFSKMIKNQKVIILGEELVNDLHGLIPRKDIFILPNAIQNEISEKEYKKISLERKKINSLNILFLSNMEVSKGWAKLLQSCPLLKKKGINFKCNFVGDFPGEKEKNLFHKIVAKNNLQENIYYLGKKIGIEKNKILKNSDILVFPTEYPLETFGRVIIEAMMFGLPVIANGIATIPSIVEDGKTGFVLKENSPEEIKNCILKLNNFEKRNKMGLSGRKKFLKDFELKKFSEKFLKIVNSV